MDFQKLSKSGFLKKFPVIQYHTWANIALLAKINLLLAKTLSNYSLPSLLRNKNLCEIQHSHVNDFCVVC